MSVTEINMTDRIQALKAAAQDLPQVHMPTKHFLLEGMYARQILIPSGTAFVGRKHKKPHYFMCLKGGAMVTLEDGSIGNLQAGMILMSPPGVQRAGLTYEDTIFVTIHRTEETDLPDIEADCTEFDPSARYGVGNEILQILPEKPS
jgi:quercetin dioxygenase-like cupin family protein